MRCTLRADVSTAWHALVRAGLHTRVDVRSSELGSTRRMSGRSVVLDAIEKPHSLVGVDYLEDVVSAARRLLGET